MALNSEKEMSEKNEKIEYISAE